MNLLQEANHRRKTGFGFNATRVIKVWQSKKVSYRWARITYGIRRSSKVQIWPIWNTSNNCERSLLFGLGMLYIEFTITRDRQPKQGYRIFGQHPHWLWRIECLVS